MVYTEYATAAERHIETCLHLLGVLETQYQSKESNSGLTPREQKEKLELLSNLYYLSGYIIECAYSYALCKHIFLNAVDDVSSQFRNAQGPPPKQIRGVCWGYNSINGTTHLYAIYRKNHKMSISEMNYFQVNPITSQGSSSSSIPIIGGNSIAHSAAQQLFDDWSAETRYTVTNLLDYSDVFEFFYACEKIYRLTRQIITTDYP